MEATEKRTAELTMAVPVVEVATVEGLKNHLYKRLIDTGAAIVTGGALLLAKFGFDQWSRARNRPAPVVSIPTAPGVVAHK